MQTIDVSLLVKGDVVHYLLPGGARTGVVMESTMYTDGIDVEHGGKSYYVSKYYIFKVERAGAVVYANAEGSPFVCQL